jgi:hypothetical protein
MNLIVHIPTTYRFIPTPEPGQTAATVEQANAPVAKAPAEDAPIDLDSALATLDDELRKLDELTEKLANFPAELVSIESKREALVSQELDSVEAIQSRSAEASKLGAMIELGQARQKKLTNAVAAQQEITIKVGERIATLLEQRWWNSYVKQCNQVQLEFDRLFYRSALGQDLQNSYKPLTLLEWLRVPDFRTSRFSPADVKIGKSRRLREAANKLAEFEKMSFAQIADRVDEIDRKSRERLRTGTGN